MQIRPGIERRYIFRSLLHFARRSTISHSSPQNLPLSFPISRACKANI
jgi:hypothetical protein